MIEDSSVGNIFEAALEHRSTDGREREIQDHYGLKENQIPLAMLETRAVTPAPTDTGARSEQEIVPAVFPDSVGSLFWAFHMPSVPVGDSCFSGPHGVG